MFWFVEMKALKFGHTEVANFKGKEERSVFSSFLFVTRIITTHATFTFMALMYAFLLSPISLDIEI